MQVLGALTCDKEHDSMPTQSSARSEPLYTLSMTSADRACVLMFCC